MGYFETFATLLLNFKNAFGFVLCELVKARKINQSGCGGALRNLALCNELGQSIYRRSKGLKIV